MTPTWGEKKSLVCGAVHDGSSFQIAAVKEKTMTTENKKIRNINEFYYEIDDLLRETEAGQPQTEATPVVEASESPVPGEPKTEAVKAPKEEKKRGAGLNDDEKRKRANKGVSTLIEMGSYKKALELLERGFDLLDDFSVEEMGKIRNWMQLSDDVERYIDQGHLESAVSILEKLIRDVPPGAGKQRLCVQLESISRQRDKEIKILRGRLKEAEKSSDKLQILTQLVRIVPPDAAEELAREKEKALKDATRRKARTWASILASVIILFTAIILAAYVIPGISLQKRISRIEKALRQDPNEALALVKELQRGQDSDSIRELRERAENATRARACRTLMHEAEVLAQNNQFDQAFGIYGRIREEVFRGTPVPEFFMDSEKKLYQDASAYYSRQGDEEASLLEKFLLYDLAANSMASIDIRQKRNRFLADNKGAILEALLQRAATTTDCPESKRLVKLCKEIRMSDPRVLRLQEEIYKRCR